MLKYSEMMWFLKNDGQNGVYLGDAGNHRAGRQIQAMRFGDEVIVNGSVGTRVISADTAVNGFGESKDGKVLRDLMVEDVIYDYLLEPIALPA
jgi:hypothetical protein